jgi:hypothetical protein
MTGGHAVGTPTAFTEVVDHARLGLRRVRF